jgi:tetratricopeptide (TPR) repeat protein
LKLKRMSPGERESAMDVDDADGYVLVRPLFHALPNFEKSEPAMKLFFPDWVRAVDTGAEAKRVATLKFSPPASNGDSEELSSEEVARARRAQMTTVPNDREAIAALTDGERQIAEKNPRAAEASFQKVLAKYPDQNRAWYGLGLVALLDHDSVRAKEVFGRLTVGEQAAAQDPMVMAWSHIYLARIYEDEGHAEVAKTEYQAALDVPGGPQQSRLVAQKGLTELAEGKPAARP